MSYLKPINAPNPISDGTLLPHSWILEGLLLREEEGGSRSPPLQSCFYHCSRIHILCEVFCLACLCAGGGSACRYGCSGFKVFFLCDFANPSCAHAVTDGYCIIYRPRVSRLARPANASFRANPSFNEVHITHLI